MLREKENLIKWCMIVLDTIIISASFFVAYFIRLKFHVFYKLDIFPSVHVVQPTISQIQYIPVMILIVLLWIFMLSLNGMYSSVRTKTILEIMPGY